MHRKSECRAARIPSRLAWHTLRRAFRYATTSQFYPIPETALVSHPVAQLPQRPSGTAALAGRRSGGNGHATESVESSGPFAGRVGSLSWPATRGQGGSLSPLTRERIALAIAQQTACEYCLSAHTAAGRKAGLNGNEMTANRAGTSEDAKAAVAVGFALKVSERSGAISLAELTELRQAGYSDADTLEIVTHVGLTLLTSMLAKAFDIDIDPPAGSPASSAYRP